MNHELAIVGRRELADVHVDPSPQFVFHVVEGEARTRVEAFDSGAVAEEEGVFHQKTLENLGDSLVERVLSHRRAGRKEDYAPRHRSAYRPDCLLHDHIRYLPTSQEFRPPNDEAFKMARRGGRRQEDSEPPEGGYRFRISSSRPSNMGSHERMRGVPRRSGGRRGNRIPHETLDSECLIV